MWRDSFNKKYSTTCIEIWANRIVEFLSVYCTLKLMTCCCSLADFMFLLQHFGPLTLIPLTQVYWYGGKTYCWGFHINDSSPVLEILLEIIKILQLAWDISTTLLFQDACLKGKNILAPTPANKKNWLHIWLLLFILQIVYEKMPNSAIIGENESIDTS